MNECVKVFYYRDSELPAFEKVRHRFGLPLCLVQQSLNLENIAETRGLQAIWLNGKSRIDESMAAALAENGVKYIMTKSSGFDHLDLGALKKYGLKAANVPYYSPNAISEHSLLLALSCIRHMKRAQIMQSKGDYSLDGLCGRELRSMTVGVVGVGRIGRETIKLLRGFGCRILVNARHEIKNDEVLAETEFVPYDRILRESDILFFHCPLSEENYHMLNRENIPRLKQGAVLINTARGGLFDYGAVLEGLCSGQIGALGFDVYEGENGIFGKKGAEVQTNATFEALCAMDNVVFTPHMGFYTDISLESLITVSMENTLEYLTTGSCKNELVK